MSSLLTRPLALGGGVVAADVATVGELDGDVVKGARESKRGRVSARDGRAVIFADTGADRSERHQVERNGFPTTGLPVDRQFDPARRALAFQVHGERAVTGRHLDVGLDDGVVVERVVVDDQTPVLHEHRTASILVAGSDQDPVVVSGPGDPCGDVDNRVGERRCRSRRNRRHRRPIGVATIRPVDLMIADPGDEQFEATLVERQHTVALRLLPPKIDQLGQSVWFAIGEVVAFGRIGGKVVELPAIVVEVDTGEMPGDSLPPHAVHFGDERSIAGELEVLQRVGRRRCGVVEHRCERVPRDRHLLDTPISGGRRDAEQFVDGRHDVGHIDELVPLRAGLFDADAIGPVHDHRHVHPALMGERLVPTER